VFDLDAIPLDVPEKRHAGKRGIHSVQPYSSPSVLWAGAYQRPGCSRTIVNFALTARKLAGFGGGLGAGCANDGCLADVGARGVVAGHVGLQLSPLVQRPDAGEGPVQAVFGDQRPDRVPVAPLLAQGAAGVEVGVALDRGVCRREDSPVGEAAVVEDL
jgi:hypothetical protein